MVTTYDDKGKVFTQVVAKDPVVVIIQTTQNVIHGTVHIRPGLRLKDELNDQNERFLAVTDLTVSSLEKVELYRSKFMIVNREQIVWVIPEEEINS
jgi:hypothetical protein